jgi:cell filamentation protein
MFDPFCDFETAGYLRNAYRYKDKVRVSAAERMEVASNAPDAAAFLIGTKSLQYSHVLKVHSILFGGLYPWAGTDRRVTAPELDISKAGIKDMFALPGHEKLAMDYALQLAANPSTMKGKPGEIMGLMAHSHPFLDGNGRTIMLVHQDLCRRAGFHIDWMKTNKSHYLHILTEELKSPGKGFLDGYLRPFIVAKPLDLTASLNSYLSVPGLNAENKGGVAVPGAPTSKPEKSDEEQSSWEPPKP